jgi:hypothetical protein
MYSPLLDYKGLQTPGWIRLLLQNSEMFRLSRVRASKYEAHATIVRAVQLEFTVRLRAYANTAVCKFNQPAIGAQRRVHLNIAHYFGES